MSYNIPALPEEPVKPGFMSGKDAKAAYQQKSRIYTSLQKSYERLKELHAEMETVRARIDLQRPQDCSTLERDKNGLFKITCPYCLEKFEVGDLEYRARVREDASGELMECFQPETDKVYADFWGRMGVNDIDSLRGHILNMAPEKREISAVTFETNAVGGKETVPFDAAARERMKRQKVLKLEDCYHNEVTERVCPKCHTQLPGDIGFCPNYIYAFMGNSSCGKTIYLNRLILTLTSGQFLNGSIFGIGANDEMAALGETAKEGAKAIFMVTGKSLAEATDVGYIPPVILRLQDTKTHQRYFITLFDYPGEAIWKDDDAFFQPLADRVRKNSNGLIFMFDSGVTLSDQLPEQYRVVSEDNYYGSDMIDPAKASAEQVISRIYTHTFKGEPVDKPVALLLSKSDLINTCMDSLTGVVWREKPSFLTPSLPHQQVKLLEMYRCHREVQTFLNAKEPGATATANVMCNGNHAWFAVSSTSVPLENGTIPEGAVVTGLRETDPLEWLLYRNGHLAADFGGDMEAAKDVMRWAAAFQVEAYHDLEQLEKTWDGDEYAMNCPGEIKIFNQLCNEYKSL